MLVFSLILQALHAIVWVIILIGSAVLLRRGYASAAVSMLLGAAIAALMTTVNLMLTTCQVTGWIRVVNASKMMMIGGLATAVGLFLFALGFMQLALAARRQD